MYCSKYISILIVFCGLFFCSCQQEIGQDFNSSNNTGGNGSGGGGGTTTSGQTFEAKMNGQLTTFKVQTATLLRSNPDNMKRVDITGVTADNSKQLTITIGDSPATGNGVRVRDYTIRLFNDDDPNTPEDESDDSDDGFLTYSTGLGANSWVTDVYAENGSLKVTACDASAKSVSGTFNVKDSSLTGGPVLNFTEGKFTNIKYIVLN